MRNRSLLILVAIVLALVPFSPASLFSSRARAPVKPQVSFIDSHEGQKIAELFRKANQAFQKNDYSGGAALLEAAYVINPQDDVIINLLAEAYVAAGDQAA